MATKSYYKISEVSVQLDVPASTLRYWEKEFPTLSPKRSGTGRRIFSVDDVEICKLIKKCLYSDRLTIEAARRKIAMYRRYSPRHNFVCKSNKDAMRLLSEVKERSADEHIVSRVDAVLKWMNLL